MFKFIIQGRITETAEELVKADGTPTGLVSFTVEITQTTQTGSFAATAEIQAGKNCMETAKSLKKGQNVVIHGSVKIIQGTSKNTGKPYNIKNFRADTIIPVMRVESQQSQPQPQQQGNYQQHQPQQPQSAADKYSSYGAGY